MNPIELLWRNVTGLPLITNSRILGHLNGLAVIARRCTVFALLLPATSAMRSQTIARSRGLDMSLMCLLRREPLRASTATIQRRALHSCSGMKTLEIKFGLLDKDLSLVARVAIRTAHKAQWTFIIARRRQLKLHDDDR